MVDDPEPLALLVGEGVDDPGHLDQMRPVMAGQGVELAGHQQAARG